jgi:hypothetical protein
VRLKDGPRDDAYREPTDAAWGRHATSLPDTMYPPRTQAAAGVLSMGTHRAKSLQIGQARRGIRTLILLITNQATTPPPQSQTPRTAPFPSYADMGGSRRDWAVCVPVAYPRGPVGADG